MGSAAAVDVEAVGPLGTPEVLGNIPALPYGLPVYGEGHLLKLLQGGAVALLEVVPGEVFAAVVLADVIALKG